MKNQMKTKKISQKKESGNCSTKLSQKDKSKFRATNEWTEFRKGIIQKKNNKCDCCGIFFKDTSKLNLHHKNLDSAEYTNISNPDNFSLLCSTCHDISHSLHTKIISKKNPTNNSDILNLVFPYFIFTPDQLKEINSKFTYCSCCGKYKNNTRRE